MYLKKNNNKNLTVRVQTGMLTNVTRPNEYVAYFI